MSPFERLRGAHLTSHPVIEDLIFTLLSLLVVAVAISVLVTPSEPTLALAVQPPGKGGGGGGTVNPKQIELYGSLVDETGAPIKSALIEVEYADGTRVASARTKTDGTFLMQFNEGAAPYTIRVTVVVNGVTVTSSTTMNVAPGMKWGIQMTLSQGSTWVFVPLPGY